MQNPDVSDIETPQPESGNEQQQQPQQPQQQQQQINDHKHCVRCGFDLYGLNLASACPECGIPVAMSQYSDELRFSDPEWIRSIAVGTTILLVTVVLTFFTSCFTPLMINAGGAELAMVRVSIGVLVAVVALIGYWRVTRPEPARTDTEPQWSARRIARICSLCAVAQPFVGILAFATPQGAVPNPVLYTGAAGLLGLCTLVGFFALCVYARSLARRIPAAGLARSTTIMMWGYGISLSVAYAGGMIAAALASSLMSQPQQPPAMASGNSAPSSILSGFGPVLIVLVIFIGISALALLGFKIYSIVLLVIYRQRFSNEAGRAEEFWRGYTHGTGGRSVPTSSGP